MVRVRSSTLQILFDTPTVDTKSYIVSYTEELDSTDTGWHHYIR